MKEYGMSWWDYQNTPAELCDLLIMADNTAAVVEAQRMDRASR